MLTESNRLIDLPIYIRNYHFASRIFGSDIIEKCYDLSRAALDLQVNAGLSSDVNALSASDIEMILDSYRDAAVTAKESGNYIGYVTATTGTLIGGFISPATNLRTDEWGGSLNNRLRLANDVIKRIRDSIGDDLVLEFRISGAEFISGGYTIEEGINIARSLDGKVDIIHVSAGVDHAKDLFIENNPRLGILHGSNIRLASEIKSNINGLVATEAGLGCSRMMNDIINSRKVDIVYCSEYVNN